MGGGGGGGSCLLPLRFCCGFCLLCLDCFGESRVFGCSCGCLFGFGCGLSHCPFGCGYLDFVVVGGDLSVIIGGVVGRW